MPCSLRLPLLAALLAAAPLLAQTGTPLLTDAELSGWFVQVNRIGRVPNAEQAFFVWEDSVLHVLPDAEAGSQQPFAVLVTDSIYDSYRLHVEYKWGEKKFAPRTETVRDAGVLFHIYDTTAFFPASLECQIQEGDTGDAWLVASRATCTLSGDAGAYSPDGHARVKTGQRYTKFARSYSWEQPGWNTVDLEVDGPTARFYVNGHLVNVITDTQKPGPGPDEWVALREGRIALQAEGAELYYRNVVISPL